MAADLGKKLSEHRYVEFSAPAEKLDDCDHIVAVLHDAAKKMGAKVLNTSAHKFEPQGVTAMLLLSTSHLAIHTWPEHGQAQLDVLSCKQGVPVDPAIEYVVQSLGGSLSEVRKGEPMDEKHEAQAIEHLQEILDKAEDQEVALALVDLNTRLGKSQGMSDQDGLMLRLLVGELDRRGLANGDAPALVHLVKDVEPGVPTGPDDALHAWAKPIYLRSPAVSLVGSVCSQHKADGDIEVMLHGPLSEELRNVLEFRLGRTLPPGIGERLQVHGDTLGAAPADYVPVYDLALVPSQCPRQVVRMSGDEPAVEWLPPYDESEVDKGAPSDEVPGNPFFTTYGTLTRFSSKILPLFPEKFDRYVELFCGNIEMLWCIPRDFNGHTQEVVNDLDKDIIRLHRTCQKMTDANAQTLSAMNWRCSQEQFNSLGNQGRGGSDLAFMHRELYLRRFSYLGREKLKLRSTDVGKVYDPLPRIMRCKARLQGVKLSNQDYRKAVAQYDSPDTMWFIDPPYPGSDDYYQLKMPSLEEQMQHFDKLKGKALIVLKGDAKELAPVTKRKSWQQFRFRWPHPWKGVFPGKYPEWQYGSIFTNYTPPGKSRTRKAWQVLKSRAEDAMLAAYPKQDKPHEAVVQVHTRGKSVHLDLRILANGHLVGWTLLAQRPGSVEGINTPEAARDLYGGYTTAQGNNAFKGIKAPVRLQAVPKQAHPVEWLKVDGMVAGEGGAAATENDKGIIVAVASPTVQWGLQSDDFHEYFLEGHSQWQGSLYLRRVALAQEGGAPEEVWLAWISDNHLPRVLAANGHAAMPPLGHSAIPNSLMKVTPKELRYWEAETQDEAKQLRDKLAASKFFTEQNVRIVDGAYERIVTKMYVDKEAKPEVATDGRIKSIVSGASLRHTWHPCDPKWIGSDDGCHAACCHSSASPNAGPCVTAEEAKVLRDKGATVKGGEMQAREKGRCFFETDSHLCDLHGTASKPLECQVSPLRVLSNGTVVVQHRHYQTKCHKVAGGVPGYEAYAGALRALFGPAQTKRIQEQAARGVDRIEASMAPEIFKAMQEIATTRITHRRGQGIPGGWGKADAGAEELLAKSAGDTMQILKTKDEQYVLGIVLEPNDGKDGSPMDPDTQGDIYSKLEVRQAAHKFMVEYRNVGLMHRSLVNGMVEILESFVVPEGTGGFDIEDPYGEKQHVREGTWLLGLRIVDRDLWEKVKQDKLSGLSIGGSARRVAASRG